MKKNILRTMARRIALATILLGLGFVQDIQGCWSFVNGQCYGAYEACDSEARENFGGMLRELEADTRCDLCSALNYCRKVHMILPS